MAYWKTEFRKINGKRRKVRVLLEGTKGSKRIVDVRIAGRPHYIDRTALKRGIAHVRGYSNQPNRDAKRNFHIGQKSIIAKITSPHKPLHTGQTRLFQ